MANGTRASFSHDSADRLATLANIASTAMYISRYDYKYDPTGNRTGVLEADGSRVTWLYDSAYQLTGENRTGSSLYRNTFTYDPNGNRLLNNAGGTRRRRSMTPLIRSGTASSLPLGRHTPSTGQVISNS